MTELDCGIHRYRVHPIFLSGHNADEIFEKVNAKIEMGESLSEEDFANLTLTPLMASTRSRKEVIKEAIQIARQNAQITAEKTMAMLYTLADKFLNGEELDEIKEVIAMTRLGQMLYDDGVKKGREEGRTEGREQEARRISALTAQLLKANRLEDLQRSTEDEEFREKLMKEFGIE